MDTPQQERNHPEACTPGAGRPAGQQHLNLCSGAPGCSLPGGSLDPGACLLHGLNTADRASPPKHFTTTPRYVLHRTEMKVGVHNFSPFLKTEKWKKPLLCTTQYCNCKQAFTGQSSKIKCSTVGSASRSPGCHTRAFTPANSEVLGENPFQAAT